MTTDAGELMALAGFMSELRPNLNHEILVAITDKDRDLIVSALRTAASQPDREAVARIIADYLYEETTKLDAPISMTACLVLAKRISLLSVQVDGEQASLLEQSRIAPLANEDQIKHMVNRFLMWKLPESFSPDCGISFKKTFNDHMPQPMKSEPIGTNLFDAQQADAMVRYMLEGLPPVAETDADAPGGTSLADLDDLDHEHRLAQEQPGGAITSAELLRRAGVDTSKPFERGHFPPEMRMPGPSDPTLSAEGMREALEHLGRALYFGAVIHPDDRNEAFETALAFYNAECPNLQIDATEHATLRTYDPAFAALSALPVQGAIIYRDGGATAADLNPINHEQSK